ncbi:Glyco-hydro-79C domain-containing protein [Mycena venus]|uniref:Glyco-hydro-79C domain-containing protein n=1 Tax=Mycena venus TaxID=2733690 RepID=A0A8H7CJR7_9AGAR|nr:Glyco-hydro-79C domain-containing protein [Mycena venus]
MYSLIPFSLLVLPSYIGLSNAAAVQVTVPATPSTSNVVHSNFLGISYELSFMTDYFGNDTDHIATPMLNYLANIRARTGNNPVRIRIGGNSADSSPYFDTASSPMVQLQQGNFNANDQPVTYNSLLWQVMASVSKSVNGVSYVINVPLAIAPNASLANDMRNILGSSLDSMLLGNEPDLYTGHGKRPNLQNYTVDDYFGDYSTAISTIGPDDASGAPDVGGPSVCCNWDLASLLQAGYLTKFSSALKYIVLQHYPQNNCNNGQFPFQLPWYLQHSNVVTLAQWQKPGIDYLLSQPDPKPELINSEFNSASCGGVPFSPSFGVGTKIRSLWSVDYALQMAVHIFTPEKRVSPYNILSPPKGPPGTAGDWTTNSPYYSLLVMAEALRTDHGAIVSDLNLGGSSTNPAATSSAYAVYNQGNKTVSRLIIFNYANSTQDFALPKEVFSSSGTALVKFLSAATPEEETNISWGGETWSTSAVTDGKTTIKPSWAAPNQNLTGCSANGCTFTAPGPSLAMVFLDDAQYEVITAATPTTNNSSSSNASPL